MATKRSKVRRVAKALKKYVRRKLAKNPRRVAKSKLTIRNAASVTITKATASKPMQVKVVRKRKRR